jgi:hypothetical protein
MSRSNLVTQGEVKDITASLGSLSDNLNDHVNVSMSKSHGWTGIQQVYQDSGGCYHSGPAGPVTLHHEARLTVGGNVFYAPAQKDGGLNQSNPLVTDPDITLPVFTGSVSPQQADPALDVTVGSPAPSVLTTSFSVEQNVVASNANAILTDHAGSPAETSHGGLSWNDRTVHDSAGHVVGRKGVNLVIGGARWTIVSDSNGGGPPQIPNLTSLCPLVTVTGGGASNSIDPVNCKIFSVWQDANPLAQFTAELEVGGTPPISFEWQYSLDGYAWQSVTAMPGYPSGPSVSVGSGNYSVAFAFTGSADGRAMTGATGIIYAEPPVRTTLVIWAAIAIGNDGIADPICFVRCKFDNTTTPGGAVVYSNGLQISTSRRA